jgi:hypothetical protein
MKRGSIAVVNAVLPSATRVFVNDISVNPATATSVTAFEVANLSR